MKPKVYIDGQEGTTGLQIYDRLAQRDDIELLRIDSDKRKDNAERKRLMDAADIVFLCLPDAAAREAVALIESPTTRVIDASTAHRTNPDWDYGFPELSAARRAAIAKSKRVANPGCHATGFISIVYPLVAMGILSADACVSAFSLTGYSGGGKKMIAQYEGDARTPDLDSPRPYGLTQAHKHVPEMTHVPGLQHAPVFAPIVADFYSGMEVTVPLFGSQLRCAHPVANVTACLKAHYASSPIVKVLSADEVAAYGGFIPSNALSGKDGMLLMVTGNDERLQIVSLFDNLGKGSSGAALQCLNLMTGMDETLGLNL